MGHQRKLLFFGKVERRHDRVIWYSDRAWRWFLISISGAAPICPIRKHGADAELEAAKRADLMLDRDDDGRLLWARIRRAIEALQALPPGRPN
jgi:hypothetical protein